MNYLKLISIAIFSFILGFGPINNIGYITELVKFVFLATLLIIHFVQFPNFIVNYIKLDFFLLFFIFIILSISQIIYGDTLISNSFFNLQYLILIVVFIALKDVFTRSTKQVWFSLFFFCLGVLFLSVYGLFIDGVIHKGQLMVFGQNPNSTSTRVAISLIVTLYVLAFTKNINSYGKYFVPIAFFIMLVFLIKSGSRGSMVSFILSAFITLILSKLSMKLKFRIIFTVVFTLLVFYLYIIGDPLLFERWASATTGDTAGRTDIWSEAFSIYMSSPIIGVGEAGYQQEITFNLGGFIDTHNLYIYILVSGGLISLLAFLLFIFNIVKEYFYDLEGEKILSVFLMINMLIIAAKTGGALVYFMMWYVFSICNALNSNRKTHRE